MNADTIQRYDTLSDYSILWTFDDGEYVRHQDHEDVVAVLRKEIQMLRDLTAGLQHTLAATIKDRAK